MRRTRWADTAGMPLRTRAFSYAIGAAWMIGTPLDRMTPEELASHRALAPKPRFPVTLITGRVSRVRSRDITVRMRDGLSLPVRIHLPLSGVNGRVLVYLHGGGFTLGRPLDYESFLTQVTATTGAAVVAPDYRLAPQAKAPQGLHDCIDTIDWVRTAPAELGGRVEAIAVGGDSAGGNLSALVAVDARDRGLPLAGQALIYPSTDLARKHTYRTAPILSGKAIDVYKRHYVEGSGLSDTDPSISPMYVESLAGVAPALVQTAQYDPLRAEGEEYAARLRAAGVPTRLTRWRGVPHGYLSFPGAAPVAAHARTEILDQLQEWWT